jgi:two-component system sensor histidine kinase/response regulator
MKRLLIIDDEDEFLDLTARLLEGHGFAVDAAPDGLTGIKMARRRPPDLILCDLVMEPLDGFMTLSVLRQHVETAPIPFVIISGRRELDSLRRGMLLGADDYLTKPFTPDELVGAINPILEHHRQAMASAGQLVRELTSAVEVRPDKVSIENVSAVRFLADELVTLSRPNAQITAQGHRRQLERALQRLTTHLGDARLLDLIDHVAADFHALAVLRSAGTVEVADVLGADLDRFAAEQGGSRRLVHRLDPGRIAMSAATLLRMAAELVSNAFHFSPRSTTVRVEGRRLDNGYLIGFENETAAKIIGTTTAQLNQPGWETRLPSMFRSGVGLRIVNGLTSLHGGTMTVRLTRPDRAMVQLLFPT